MRASDVPDLGFQPGDHVCAFYNGGENLLNKIVMDYISKGLEAGNKCLCIIDTPSVVRDQIPVELVSLEGSLQVLTEDEAYMPDGYFSKDAFIDSMEKMVQEAFADGYNRFRAVGDESFIVRHKIDIKEWFAAESELNKIVPDYPHFFFCLYDLDLFDGNTVMYVLRTHPRVYVNGLIFNNPYYDPADHFPG